MPMSRYISSVLEQHTQLAYLKQLALPAAIKVDVYVLVALDGGTHGHYVRITQLADAGIHQVALSAASMAGAHKVMVTGELTAAYMGMISCRTSIQTFSTASKGAACSWSCLHKQVSLKLG